MDIEFHYGAVNPSFTPLFNPLLPWINQLDSVDLFQGFVGDCFDTPMQDGLLERFTESDSAEPALDSCVCKVEGKSSVTVAFHLLDNGSSKNLFGRHSPDPGFIVVRITEIL